MIRTKQPAAFSERLTRQCNRFGKLVLLGALQGEIVLTIERFEVIGPEEFIAQPIRPLQMRVGGRVEKAEVVVRHPDSVSHRRLALWMAYKGGVYLLGRVIERLLQGDGMASAPFLSLGSSDGEHVFLEERGDGACPLFFPLGVKEKDGQAHDAADGEQNQRR